MMNCTLRSIISPLRSYSKHAIRSISSTAVKHDSYKIQDTKDFEDKVKNSKEPVIVDFFAT